MLVSDDLDVFDRYVEALGGIEGVHFMPELEGTYSNRWLTALTLEPKKVRITPYALMDALEAVAFAAVV